MPSTVRYWVVNGGNAKTNRSFRMIEPDSSNKASLGKEASLGDEKLV